MTRAENLGVDGYEPGGGYRPEGGGLKWRWLALALVFGAAMLAVRVQLGEALGERAGRAAFGLLIAILWAVPCLWRLLRPAAREEEERRRLRRYAAIGLTGATVVAAVTGAVLIALLRDAR